MKAVIIANPTAGKEKASVYQEELKLELSKRYDEVIIHETAKEGDATRLAAEEASADLIVAVGGDGTLSEVINGIAPLDVRPPISFIPLGTVNEFARALKMAPDLWQGKIKESEHVQMFTCKRLHIEAEEALTTNVNGDPGPQLPADIVVMKRYLTVLAP